jgi:UDP-2,4-diacetamido-2,4,6-trideoxy-beta-L-altropyranose hydrolase
MVGPSEIVYTNCKQRSLLIRADATVSIGAGHVVRCLALGQAWQSKGGCVTLAAAEMVDGLKDLVLANGVSLLPVHAIPGRADDARVTVALSYDLNAAWTVVDGDRFTNGFLRELRASESRLLLIDDFGTRDVSSADLVVNPNFGADPAPYRAIAPQVPVLRGPKYALLRREFRNRRTRILPETANRILITLGGTDPDNLTPRVISALATLSDFYFTVVVGPGNKNVDEVTALGSDNMRVLVDSRCMADVMHECDLGIIAAGGTLWELLSVGCAVLSYSRNSIHQRVLGDLARLGVLVDLGLTSDFDSGALVSAVLGIARSRSSRANMTSLGRELVDGFGADRVVEAMRSPLQPLQWRPSHK